MAGKVNVVVSGKLDDKAYDEVSFNGSGQNAFVMKGFLPGRGAVRFRCEWFNLSSCTVWYLPPGATEWDKKCTLVGEPTFDMTKMKLAFAFKEAMGNRHTASFYAKVATLSAIS